MNIADQDAPLATNAPNSKSDPASAPSDQSRFKVSNDPCHSTPQINRGNVNVGNRAMKVGVVSDIHCNARGLSQALALMGNIDELICLGDSIYEYRFSNEVVALLRQHDAQVIVGNHEEYFFGPHGDRARARDGIDPELAAWLAGQPYRRELTIGGKRLLLVHSTPWEPRGAYIHPGSTLLAGFAEADAEFVLYGHTHQQLVERIGRVLVINPGSAGDARDPRNGGLLSCAVLDTKSEEVTLIDFPDPQRDAA
ncbi:MAG: metallophosphoesterase [Alphaproteobacteria bacterium]